MYLLCQIWNRFLCQFGINRGRELLRMNLRMYNGIQLTDVITNTLQMKSHDLKMLNLKDRKKNTLIQDSLLYDKCRVLKKSEDKFLTKGQPAYKR